MLAGITHPILPSAAPQKVSAVALLDLYDRGDYATASGEVIRATAAELDRLDGDLSAQAEQWIDAGGTAQHQRRTFIAGAVALEITQALTARHSRAADSRSSHAVNPVALLRLTRLIAQGPSAPPSDIERDWILACLATWEDWNPHVSPDMDWRQTPAAGWAVLLGQRQVMEHAVLARIDNPVFLDWALERFPNDPRLRLAVIEGHEAIGTRCAEPFCHDEMTPAALEDLRARAKASPPDDQAAGCLPYCGSNGLLREIHDSAVANLEAFDRLLAVASEFAALAKESPSVREEADVHIGYLAIRAGRADAALPPLATAATSDDPYVRYLADHFTGRALGMLGHRADAIAAYRRALSIVPNAASTSTLLAAQLFGSDDATERAEAHTVVESAIAASPRPIDPWDLYWQGDGRLRTVYLDRLRQDLRP